MYELIQVSENCYYIQSPAKIGLVKVSEDEVILIDTGNDKDAGKKVNKLLDANGWKLSAIYNTHSNADHIGGNKFLQGKTNCKIYVPGIECDFTNHTILEPAFLFGAYPFKDLTHKFIKAQESEALPLTKECLPAGFESIPLPGHFLDMVGFRTPDDVVYLADCLSSKETLDKYQVSFVYDVKAYLETLEAVCNMKAKLFIPAHAEATEDIVPLAKANIAKVHEIEDKLLSICEKPLNFEEILKKVFDDYSLVMTMEQYALVGSTIRSYLSYLYDAGRMKAYIEDSRLLWEKA